jgi:hypothetical protein
MLHLDLRRIAVPVVLASAGLALAQPASAADYCVKPNTTCGGTVVNDLQTALNAAATAKDADRIFLGDTTYKPPAATGFVYDKLDGPVEIIGVGQTHSVITGQDGGNSYVLKLFGGPGSSLRDLDVQMAANVVAGTTGLYTNALAKHIRVVDNPPGNVNTRWAVALFGNGALEDSNVLMELDGQTGGVNFQSPETAIRDSGVNARIGVGSYFGGTIERSGISGGYLGVAATRNTTKIDSSTIYTYSSQARAIDASTTTGYQTSVVGDGLTIAGDETTPGSSGVVADTWTAPAESVSVTLRNSLIRYVAKTLIAAASGAGTATIAASYSDYGAPNNSNGPKAFITEDHISDVGSTGFDPDNFLIPLPGSPLIDAGDPAEPQGLDINRDPLVTDGDHDGVARRDIGATEFPGPLPSDGLAQPGADQALAATTPEPPAEVPADKQAPVVSGFKTAHSSFAIGHARTALNARVARGTIFSYRLSEAAKVVVAIRRVGGASAGSLTRSGKAGANSLRFSGRLGRKALKPGAYRAVITATDAAGNRSAPKVVRFRIVGARG